jgi:hypothetical protein
MTVNAGRGRRRAPVAAEVEPAPKPASRRRAAPAGTTAPAASPDPGTTTSRTPLHAVPPPPSEQPAILYPSDRRGVDRPFSTPSERQGYGAVVGSLAIGEIDQTLFDCPSCRRPLALGARRCPGCGLRIVRGVALGKAAVFVAVGLFVGAIAGVGGALLGAGLTAPVAGGAIIAAASQPAPSASLGSPPAVGPSEAPSTPSPTVGGEVSSATAALIGQVLVMNDRLGAAETELRAALANRAFDASEVARILRTVSADSLFGTQLAARVASWSGAGDLGARLTTFYGSIHDAAGAALVNSVRNVAAYRTAARTMVDLIAGRTIIDDDVRALAASAGVSLPASLPPAP